MRASFRAGTNRAQNGGGVISLCPLLRDRAEFNYHVACASLAKKLFLYDNKIGDMGAGKLAEALPKLANLEEPWLEVHVRNCRIVVITILPYVVAQPISWCIKLICLFSIVRAQ